MELRAADRGKEEAAAKESETKGRSGSSNYIADNQTAYVHRDRMMWANELCSSLFTRCNHTKKLCYLLLRCFMHFYLILLKMWILHINFSRVSIALCSSIIDWWKVKKSHICSIVTIKTITIVIIIKKEEKIYFIIITKLSVFCFRIF